MNMARERFGPDYLSRVKLRGVGLGINPSDFHDSFLAGEVDYLEVTAPTARLRGAPGYHDVIQGSANGGSRRTIPQLVGTRPILVHSTNVNPAYPEPCTTEDLAELSHLVNMTGAPWVTEDLGVWLMSERHVYPFFMPMPYTPDVLAVCIENIGIVQEALGVPFNAEFPPTTLVLGDMHPFDFFRWLVEETGCCVCLDLGHVLSYQLARGASPWADSHKIPWNSVAEIHIAGGGIDLTTAGFQYQDNHGDHDIITICLDMLDQVIDMAPNLKAITLEVFGARIPRKALDTLGSLRQRPSVQAWLRSERLTPQRSVDLEAARLRAKAEHVAIYDTLHSAQPIEASMASQEGAELAHLIAPQERRRFDYERASRVQLLGGALTGYFPLTTDKLAGSGALTLESLNLEVLAAMPPDGSDTWPALVSAFERLLDAVGADQQVRALFAAEQWMNDCVRECRDQAKMDFPVDVLGPDPLDPNPTTLEYKGGMFYREAAADSRQVCRKDHHAEPGQGPCCTGD